MMTVPLKQDANGGDASSSSATAAAGAGATETSDGPLPSQSPPTAPAPSARGGGIVQMRFSVLFVLILAVFFGMYEDDPNTAEVDAEASAVRRVDRHPDMYGAFEKPKGGGPAIVMDGTDPPRFMPWLWTYWGSGANHQTNHFCEDMDNATRRADAMEAAGDNEPGRTSVRPRVVMNATFHCARLLANQNVGQGNWISAFYAMRLMAIVKGDVELVLRCAEVDIENDTHSHEGWLGPDDLVLPWMFGTFPAVSRRNFTSSAMPHASHPLPPPPLNPQMSLPPYDKACSGYVTSPIEHMIPYIRHDFRRMAVATVGVPGADSPVRGRVFEYANEWLYPPTGGGGGGGEGEGETNGFVRLEAFGYRPQMPDPLPPPSASPSIPDLELDDVAIHFRCGDILGGAKRSDFGIMGFAPYRRYVHPAVRSIGIVTQPFVRERLRNKDRGRAEDCEKIVVALQTYLAESFPHAKVTVRNDEKETVTSAFGRLIMANQTFCSVSSFGVIPALSTFGTGYIMDPRTKRVNPFVPAIPSMYDEHDLVIMNEKKLSSAAIRGMGIDKTIQWALGNSTDNRRRRLKFSARSRKRYRYF